MKKILILILSLALPAFAQVTPTTPTKFGTRAEGASTAATATATTDKPKPLSAVDKKFVRDSLDSMYFLMEIIGRAKKEARVDATKQVANKVHGDLTKVWEEVAGVAGERGEKIPTALAGSDKSKAERLGKSGDRFDKDFFRLAGTEAAKLVRTFDSAAKSANEEAIKKIASTWAPTIKNDADELDKAEKEAAKAK
jgi:predicted outer membrane protein